LKLYGYGVNKNIRPNADYPKGSLPSQDLHLKR
jgi:hypothetical protein